MQRTKNVLLWLLRVIQRDLAVTVIQMMIPVRQKKKGRTVCKEKRAIKMRKKHIIGILMAEIDHLSVDPTVNAFTGITELKWGTTLEGAEKSMEYYLYLMFPMDSILLFGLYQHHPPR